MGRGVRLSEEGYQLGSDPSKPALLRSVPIGQPDRTDSTITVVLSFQDGEKL